MEPSRSASKVSRDGSHDIERPRDNFFDLTLERPALGHRAAFLEWLADWKGDAYDPYRWIFKRAWVDFSWYVGLCKRLRVRGHPPELPVPLDVLWAFCGSELVGELYVFYEPMRGDNHIGYKVKPSARRRGIARALLEYGLQALRRKHILEARLTCDCENVASCSLIEGFGGRRISDVRHADGRISRRFVIDLSGSA